MTKQRPWTKEEVETLIEAVQQAKGTQQWVFGQRVFVWGGIATELNRTVASVQNKYSELRRKGIVSFEG